jgi:hypothetical protein
MGFNFCDADVISSRPPARRKLLERVTDVLGYHVWHGQWLAGVGGCLIANMG